MSEAPPRDRPSFAIGGFGVVAAWHGPLGPAVVWFEKWSRKAPQLALGLGHAGADLPTPPAVRREGKRLVVAWCEEDGAWSCEVDLESGEASEPVHRIEGARRVAFGGEVLFAADHKGLLALRPDEDAPLRVLAERRESVRLSGVRVRDEAVLAFVHPGDSAWGTVSVPARGEPSAVKHDLRAPCFGVRARAVGSRAAVMLELAGGGARLALLGRGGKVIERPHEVFPKGVGGLSSPDVVWTDDRWTAVAHRPDHDDLLFEPVGGKGDRFSLPRCAGPFCAHFFHNRFYALEAEPRADAAELRMWRADPDGGRPQQRVIEVVLDNAEARRAARDVRALWRGLAHRLETSADYRTHRARPVLDPDGATLRVVDAAGRVTLSARPAEEGVSLRITSAKGEDDLAAETPSSLVRLARWIRRTWRAEARAEVEARETWARGLAEPLSATVREVEVAGNTLVLWLMLARLPDVDTFERWLRMLRAEDV